MNDSHWERKLREKFSFLYPSEQASKEISRGIVIGLAIVVGSIVLYAIFQTTLQPTSVGYKCPEDYKTKEEYLNDVNRYIDEALIKNPNVTEEEILEQRLSLMDSLGCKGVEQYITENEKEYLNNEEKCPIDGIDWQAAVLALVLYNNKHGIEGIDFHNMDQTEIERHFEENCQQDIQIYNDFVYEHSQ